MPDGTPGAKHAKGYICPTNSFCVVGENPYGNTVSFDNILHSLELVFVVMTSNTFSSLMYYTADSDYLAACLCKLVLHTLKCLTNTLLQFLLLGELSEGIFFTIFNICNRIVILAFWLVNLVSTLLINTN